MDKLSEKKHFKKFLVIYTVSMVEGNPVSVQVMLTTRNIFIANLAVSDIFLCAFTMPLTLVDLVTKFWTLGENQVRRV